MRFVHSNLRTKSEYSCVEDMRTTSTTITQAFLYKFLNDKFLYEISLVTDKDVCALNDSEYTEIVEYKIQTDVPKFQKDQLLTHLIEKANSDKFAELFDKTLFDISTQNDGIFSVHTVEGTSIGLFDQDLVRNIVHNESSRDDFCKAIVSKLGEVKFSNEIFAEGFDFFSNVFEYMIGDYNSNGGGVYAEYYTPHAVAKIMAQVLVCNESPTNVTAYDPSAGSGTLLMNIAQQIGQKKCTVYSQDISQKSSNLLRLNLILNSLVHSISNVRQGNTILSNAFPNKKYDFIVSNPPFKLDFSDWRDQLPQPSDRFFAGVPTIPAKNKKKMAIYLLFIQHIMHSLTPTGKAAIVVPTGFVTAASGIAKKIRERLVGEKWLKGAISMPSNIFANTGTNVSVILIDKSGVENPVLVDASKLGTVTKVDGKNQKTVLSAEEEQQIVDAFNSDTSINGFSVVLDSDKIATKNYSFAAGQYFDIKIEYTDITAAQFEAKMDDHKTKLQKMFSEGAELEQEIFEQLSFLQFNEEVGK
ncbi:DNA methyltransferase [Actinomycetota bacterium]|nr:DNA methyltransferase [Actinomycetota bacterium]